jgi:S1 domain
LEFGVWSSEFGVLEHSCIDYAPFLLLNAPFLFLTLHASQIVMIKIGEYNFLKVIKKKPIGVFVDDDEIGILLPQRFVPPGTEIGDELKVFLYHDGEDRVIATTIHPKAVLGDIVKLNVVSTTEHERYFRAAVPTVKFYESTG